MCPTILEVDMRKLAHNIDHIVNTVHNAGLSCAIVSKCVLSDPRIAALIDASAADYIADARLPNLAALHCAKPRWLLRIAAPSEVEAVVGSCELSHHSERYTLGLLAEAAARQGKRHKVVLMSDVGDLREGIIYDDTELLLATAQQVLESPYLELYGLSCNLSCFGGILPDQNNMTTLHALAEQIRRRFDIELPLISGGATSSLPLLAQGRMPRGVNNLRIGEAALCGYDTSGRQAVPGCYQDAFTLQAELIELQLKPSVPIGRSGVNAFGETVVFPERGRRLRGIVSIGRMDTDFTALTPPEGVEILGASSDHMILDLQQAGGRYRLGDHIPFGVGYSALLRACAGPFISKRYIGE
ncbi:MAG: alanine/ornithine racemase family PLP-dependent enzyme [Bacillota bacterium]|nr:alanine/ornithine racemase family PLP-dependent enzyme [Bacillota bacterium]